MKLLFVSISLVALVALFDQTKAVGCTDDQSCTDLCGLQGQGECVNNRYCKFADCPMRSIYGLASLPKICTLDPTCICPAPVLSATSGKIYTGHRCLHKFKPVCVCFCLPTNPLALVNVLKCPFVNSRDYNSISPFNSMNLNKLFFN